MIIENDKSKWSKLIEMVTKVNLIHCSTRFHVIFNVRDLMYLLFEAIWIYLQHYQSDHQPCD